MNILLRFMNHRAQVLTKHLPPVSETTVDRRKLLEESRGRLTSVRDLQKRALPVAAKLRQENEANHFRQRVERATGGIQDGHV